MTQIHCDRCLAVITEDVGGQTLLLDNHGHRLGAWDLCEPCIIAFTEWVKETESAPPPAKARWGRRRRAH